MDSEQAVLGSILIDRDAIIEVADFLHRRISTARPTAASTPRCWISSSTRAARHRHGRGALERVGELEAVGGASYLSTLGNDTPTAVHVAQYGRIVERKALLRRLIQAAGKIAAIGYEDGPDIQESIDRSEAELFAVSQRRSGDSFSALKALLHDAYDRLDYLTPTAARSSASPRASRTWTSSRPASRRAT